MGWFRNHNVATDLAGDVCGSVDVDIVFPSEEVEFLLGGGQSHGGVDRAAVGSAGHAGKIEEHAEVLKE